VSHVLKELNMKGMFGCARKSKITIVLGIGIAIVYPNANLLFRNIENSRYSAILWSG
jgi:hypothetical protein